MAPLKKQSYSARYFHNSSEELKTVDAHDELLASLGRINTHNPPVQTCSTGWTFHGLYTGPTSIAFLFYRLAHYYPDLEFKDQPLLDWSQAYLDLSRHIRKPDPDPNHCGIANETIAYFALQAALLKDASLASKVCSYSSVINGNAVEGSNEWLYGRAGYLYFLRFLGHEFIAEQYPSITRQISQAASQTIARITSIPQPWKWHGTHYLGAAHGVIGIITQVVLSDPSKASSLKQLLDHVLEQQLPTGNFSSSLPADSDKLIQFCHGGPGFILSLESIKQHFPKLESEIQHCLTTAKADTWRRGLLTKEPSLCHGIAGNALALDDWDQVKHFLGHMTSSSLEEQDWLTEAGRSDRIVSLYTGEAGRAWTWAVADLMLSKTCIGYNDL